MRFLQTQSAPVDTVIKYDSELDSGTAYIGGSSLDLTILRGFPVLGATIVRGTGRVQLWGHWHANEPTDARLSARRLAPRSADADRTQQQAPPGAARQTTTKPLSARAGRKHRARGPTWPTSDSSARKIALSPACAACREHGGHIGHAAEYMLQLKEVDVAAPATLAMLTSGGCTSAIRKVPCADLR